jgi:hypothetical protein
MRFFYDPKKQNMNNEPINRGRLGHSKTFLKDVENTKTYY